MDSFIWGANFETGRESVDAQHRRLVELINSFGARLARNDVADRHMEDLLQSLVDYARFHFQDEEELMARYRLDQRHCAGHIAEHKAFIVDVAFMNRYRRKSDMEEARALLDFLIHWLAYHILGSDKNMAGQIKAIDQGLSAGEAYRQMESAVSESVEPLLAAVNGLFRQVSKRNRELSALNERLEAMVEERTRELIRANADLQVLAMTDALTALPNRRSAMLQLHELWKEADRLNTHLSCMVIDADGFKEVNDRYGHDAGDLVLQRLARELRHSVRSDDVVCRMGGDEFLIICPFTPIAGALHLAEQTRAKISHFMVKIPGGCWQGSISVGVASSGGEVASVDELLKIADRGVYLAKNSGRNCVRTCQSDSE